MRRNQHRRLSADDEQQLAETILDLERTLRSMLDDVPACRAQLQLGSDREEATRHGAVERLGAAVAVARSEQPAPEHLAQIVATWTHAESLRWRLALSAEHVALGEARRYASPRVSREDLQQEGILGLLAAATRFEPGHGVRFGAYARWWVRAKLVAVLRVAEVFRISSGAAELHRNVQKLMVADLHQGRERPMSALAAELGVAPKRLYAVLAAVAIRPEEGGEDQDEHAMVAGLPDLDRPSPEQSAVDASMARRLRDVIAAGFSERERHILEHRYAEPGMSVASIAAVLSLSAERVRQLEHQCLVTLRSVFERELDV